MRDDLFRELLESIEEATAIQRGKAKPARTTFFRSPAPREIRKRLNLSQKQFSSVIGVSVATLRNWEQGRRRPRGAAKVLLMVAA